MCGVCGELAFDLDPGAMNPGGVHRMMEAVYHRGPDDGNAFIAPPIALGYRRLSIIDLATGCQPMTNEDGTLQLVYNGEIYNYKELRTWLEARGHRFRTASDTEVVVHLYEEMGEDCVTRLQGMFAFALWDGRRHQLLLARDRVGIKPLYYSYTRERLLFASEVKALLAHGSLARGVDERALDTFLTYLYTPGERTLFAGVTKLPPGHYLTARPDGSLKIRQYWDLDFSAKVGGRSFAESVAELTDLLRRTVRSHLISDVPVGVLLSGGVDSTGVLSFAAAEVNQPINTFAIGFDSCYGQDERPYARLAARHFGTTHHETTLSPEQFLASLPCYVWHMEDPVCEPPGIALYFLTRLARQHVTVLLSGEGGDEAFAGYQTYRNFLWLERARQLLGPLAPSVSRLFANRHAARVLPRIAKYAPLLQVRFEDYYYSRTSTPFAPFNLLRSEFYTDDFRARLPRTTGHHLAACLPHPIRDTSLLDRMLYVDTKTWLPDDLLVKADKLTMAHSLELRVPLLDHQLLEFAASLPPSHKLRGWRGKRILRAVLRSRVPSAILNRPKAGFVMPTAAWLCGPLRDPVREILMDRRTLQRGYFRPQAIKQLLDQRPEHPESSKEIFSLLVLELWHRIFLEQEHALAF
jgi:asparagine synthase (glutamine-hydrolysing)